MTAPVGPGQAEHYTWGGDCDGWRHLSGQDLSVIRERIPPQGGEVPHFHRSARQLFFCLAGTLSIELEGARHELPPDHSLEVPPGTAHRVFNAGAGDAWFLVISAPTTRGDRVELPPSR